MKKDSITFSVEMTAKEVYRFTFYHVYHGFSGLFGLCLSLLALANLIMNFHDLSDMGKTIMIIVAMWFTVWEPFLMIGRSKSQVKRSKAYQKPLYYQIDGNGITVSQKEESQTIAWSKLVKVVETRSQFLVYSSRIHAFIFPKTMMDGQEEEMRYLVVHNTLDTNVRLKGRIKKLQNAVRMQKTDDDEE